MSESDDRPRGLLTPTDREFLRGEIEYPNKQQDSNRYHGIRKRITNGILDFNLIWALLRDSDRKRIFRDPADAAGVEDPIFIEALRNMLYWTYLGLKEQRYDFQSLLTDAVEQVEQDFAGKYSGKSVDVEVRFDIDVTRSADLDELIAVVESGGPVKANRLYDLLKMSSGVPIDPSELDTLRVWFQSSYPEGEKKVIESLFSEYLGVDVEITDAIARVSLSDQDVEKTDAVVDPDQERPDPGVIKGRRSRFSIEDVLENNDERRLPRSLKKDLAQSNTENNPSLLDEFFDGDESGVSTIRELMAEPNSSEDKNESVSPEDVLELLERIDESFVSTAEVAAALGAAPEAANQALKSLSKESSVRYRSVLDKDGDETEIWWRSSAEDSAPS